MSRKIEKLGSYNWELKVFAVFEEKKAAYLIYSATVGRIVQPILLKFGT